MEIVRITILLAALLIIIGVSGLIYTGNFIEKEPLLSNFGLVVVALLLLIFAAYMLSRQEIRLQLKRLFLEKSDEATLLFVKNELENLKNYLIEVKKIDKRNANKILKEVKSRLEKLVPYKVYLSSIFAEGDFLENVNRILSYDKITSKNLSEFAVAIKEIRDELAEFSY